MSQAIPFVIFYATAIGIGSGLIVTSRLGVHSSVGARAAVQAAAKGAALQGKKAFAVVGAALGLLSLTGAITSRDSASALLSHGLTPVLVAAVLGGGAWFLGGIGLEQASVQVELDGVARAQTRLAHGTLGRGLVANSVGAILGLIPSTVPEDPGLGRLASLSACVVLIAAASLSSSAEAVGLAERGTRRTLASLAGAVATGFFRPVRAALLLGTVSLLVHSELGGLLGRASVGERNLGIYLLAIQAAGTFALSLGLLAVRQGYGERSRTAWIRGVLSVLLLLGAAIWLLQGIKPKAPDAHASAGACLAAFIPLALGAALPLFLTQGRRWIPFFQGALVAMGAVTLGLSGLGQAEAVDVTRYVLIGASGALLPLTLTLQSAADMPFTSAQFSHLVLDTDGAPAVPSDASLRSVRGTASPLLLCLALGLGLGLSEVTQLNPALLGAALFGTCLMSGVLFAHREQTRRGEQWCSVAIAESAGSHPSSAPPFGIGLDISLNVVRKAAIPPLSFAAVLLIALGALATLGRDVAGPPRLGIWLGCFITTSLALLLSGEDDDSRAALGPLAYSMMLVGTAALGAVDSIL